MSIDMKHILMICLLGLLVIGSAHAQTDVMGFSQTGQWTRHVSVGWHSAARGGCSVEVYAGVQTTRPPFLTDRCWSAIDESATRIILNISSNECNTSDLACWVNRIVLVLMRIENEYPNAQMVVMEPVVGSNDGTTCGGVRAAINHDTVDEAILSVLADPPALSYILTSGLSPEVACSGYSDNKGHLNVPGGRAVASDMETFHGP